MPSPDLAAIEARAAAVETVAGNGRAVPTWPTLEQMREWCVYPVDVGTYASTVHFCREAFAAWQKGQVA